MTLPSRGNLFDPLCPTRQIIDLIGDKWTSIVVLLLYADGPTRFNELARKAEGISFKMLTRTLRRLEREGLVERSVQDGRTPAVSYSLTKTGAGLVPLLGALRDWAESHIVDIVRARAAYDGELIAS